MNSEKEMIEKALEAMKEKSWWKMKHYDAQNFYTTNKEELFKIWEKVKGDKEFGFEVWRNFVESKELWGLVFKKVSSLSSHFMTTVAQSELPHEGIEAVCNKGIFPLLPVVSSQVPFKGTSMASIFDMVFGPHYVTQQFIKTILIYMFADVSEIDFSVHFETHDFPHPINMETINQKL